MAALGRMAAGPSPALCHPRAIRARGKRRILRTNSKGYIVVAAADGAWDGAVYVLLALALRALPAALWPFSLRNAPQRHS